MGWLKLLARKGRTFKYLSAVEKSLLIQALLLLPLINLSLHLGGMKRTQRRLRYFSRKAKKIPQNQEFSRMRQTTHMVAVASRYSRIWSNCLRQSLVLWYLLRRQGIETELRIGVRQQAGKIQAHAWLESGDFILNDGQDVRRHYATFKGKIEF